MRIKRYISAVIFIAAVTFTASFDSYADASKISASAAVVISQQTGEVLYEKNSHERRSMASTTKIMTAYIALLQGEPDKVVTINEKMLAEGTSVGLKAGDKISLLNLVYGMLLQSGNDAANAVAYAVSGSRENFAGLMNKYAAEIGMKDTCFVTPSGLDAQNHYTTAYDMALLARRAMSLAQFEEICKQKSAVIDFISPDKSITVSNHNKLLSTLDGTVGIKTGFTKKSGRCLVSAVKRDGVQIIIVTLNDPDDWYDHSVLAEYGFSLLKKKKVEINELPELKIAGGTVDCLRTKLLTDTNYFENVNSHVKCRIYMKKFEYAPVNDGDIVGRADIVRNGEVIKSIPIAADGSAERKYTVKGNKIKLFTDKLINIFRKGAAS